MAQGHENPQDGEAGEVMVTVLIGYTLFALTLTGLILVIIGLMPWDSKRPYHVDEGYTLVIHNHGRSAYRALSPEFGAWVEKETRAR